MIDQAAQNLRQCVPSLAVWIPRHSGQRHLFIHTGSSMPSKYRLTYP